MAKQVALLSYKSRPLKWRPGLFKCKLILWCKVNGMFFSTLFQSFIHLFGFMVLALCLTFVVPVLIFLATLIMFFQWYHDLHLTVSCLFCNGELFVFGQASWSVWCNPPYTDEASPNDPTTTWSLLFMFIIDAYCSTATWYLLSCLCLLIICHQKRLWSWILR